MDGNKFKNNTAPYGNDIASYPSTMSLLSAAGDVMKNRHLIDFDNIVSGQKVNFPLKIALIDDLQQIVSFGYDFILATITGTSNSSVSGVTQVSPVNGIITFDNIVITSEPKSMTYLSVFVANYKSNDGTKRIEESNLEISIQTRDCIKGEYKQNNQCVYCKTGTYSFNPEQQCDDCTNNANCYGGYNVAPNPGYWHGSNETSTVYECLNTDACLGGREIDIGRISLVGECETGYSGRLCQVCKDGYSFDTNNSCAKCPEEINNIIRICIVGLVVLIVLMLIIRSTMRSAYKSKSIFSIYIKIMLNYLQLISLTSQLRLQWPDIVDVFLSSQGTPGEVSIQFLSIECLMKSEDMNFYYVKMIVMTLLPLGCFVVVALFWGCIALIKRKTSYLRNQLVSTSIILFFMLYPSLSSYLFSVFSCKEIYGEEFLMANLDIKCGDADHTFYVLVVALPGIIIWSIGTPWCIFIYLRKVRKQLHMTRFKLKLGFLYNGYRETIYFWEFVILARNLCFIIFYVFFNNVSVYIQALSCFSVVLAYFYLHHLYKPFQFVDLNQTEFLSVFVSLFTLYCGLYYMTKGVTYEGEVFLFILIIATNSVFFITLIFKMFKEKKQLLVKYLPFLADYINDDQIQVQHENRFKVKVTDDEIFKNKDIVTGIEIDHLL